MTAAELRALMHSLGEPAYRAAQIATALYAQRVASLDEMTTLSAGLRERLRAEGYEVGLPVLAQTAKSVDGTERYLVRLADGETVETVWMPDGDLPEDDERGFKRATICISSQVGCAVNCQFCLTAKLGQKRNLTAGEIAGQVAAVLNRHEVSVGTNRAARGNQDRINLVFMGMGEPFLNYDAFMDAVRLLNGEMGIATSRMTVSTSGIEPAIRRFAQEPVAAQPGAEPERLE